MLRGRWLYRDLGKSIPGERNTAEAGGSQSRFLVNEVEAEVGLLGWDQIVTPARSSSVDHGKGAGVGGGGVPFMLNSFGSHWRVLSRRMT